MDIAYSERTRILLGEKAIKRLENAWVVVVGLGGVGGYALEGLVRAGIGKITAIDGDRVDKSNINRQIIATTKTLGLYKADAAGSRMLDINPSLVYEGINCFINKQNVQDLISYKVDFVIDAIDSVPDKVAIALYCKQNNIPQICCLGTGNRIDSKGFEITDIYKTHGCPLARKVRYNLKRVGVESLDTLYSLAPVYTNNDIDVIGSVSYLPAIAGLKLCEHVIKKLIKE